MRSNLNLQRLVRSVPRCAIPLVRPAAVLRPFSSSGPSLDRAAPRGWTPTPFVTETVGGGWHTYDIFSRLLKERIICLNGEVDETLSASIVAQLLFLEADNPKKPIHLYINSPGGSVTAVLSALAGLAIYDTMTYIASPVSTICVGQAASMGSLLLCGGQPGKRYCLPHSSIMVHQPSGGYFGQASDIAIHAKEILRVRTQLNQIYQRHLTGKNQLSLDEIEKLMERDYFMGAKEALELGIVDEILDRRVQSQAQGGEGEGKPPAI
ncbi:ATP-dependent Clp protease proteolytic subunit [Penicillium canariense]|uniref:ATP-dependent Clp protease proteolytic subunit n=1 Tax=Penicillium canariense TaxID=189055 RepID=A0A9W9HTX4_9EURO|nr:ATP-dependent Clp protease proteolytic subunit [Penicillium canariense]KAJ5153359.1 ATP-dependent Clp protease proteolytic subunit [Penicillium canariense]